MFRMNAAMLRDTLQQLQKATQGHREWHQQFLRALVCGLPCPDDVLADDAHEHCDFGHWYYGEASAELRELRWGREAGAGGPVKRPASDKSLSEVVSAVSESEAQAG